MWRPDGPINGTAFQTLADQVLVAELLAGDVVAMRTLVGHKGAPVGTSQDPGGNPRPITSLRSIRAWRRCIAPARDDAASKAAPRQIVATAGAVTAPSSRFLRSDGRRRSRKS